MKRFLIVSLLMTAALSARALNWGAISVHTEITAAVESAKAQQKMLFVLTGTGWCPHCTDLEDFLGRISGTINADYVVYYCDGEAKNSPMYTTEGYPTWGIFNPYLFDVKKRWKSKGRIYKGLGFMYEKTVLTALDSALAYWNKTGRGASAGGKVDIEVDTPFSFYLDLDNFPLELNDCAVLSELLPTEDRPEAALLTAKQKLKVVEKAAKVTYRAGYGVSVSDPSGNLSSLKLSFNKRQQSFKGSFKIYAVSAKGKLKKFNAKVQDGVFIGGEGTAVVSISGIKGQTWTAPFVPEGL